jgi:hypothetical protein
LFKQWINLHVAPGERSSFQWQLYKTKVPDCIIENESVRQTTAWLITVAQGSIEIKIAKKNPILLIIYLMVFEPVNKFHSSRLGARAIHIG